MSFSRLLLFVCITTPGWAAGRERAVRAVPGLWQHQDTVRVSRRVGRQAFRRAAYGIKSQCHQTNFFLWLPVCGLQSARVKLGFVLS